MKTCNDCKNRGMKRRCDLYTSMSTYAEKCKDFEEKKQTNADRIRSMSDDELNDLFHEIYNAGIEDASSYEWGQRTNNFEWTMDWLQMPTETQKEG